MKIAVCVNHVPDTETKIKVSADNVSIDKTGVNYMLNPYDEFGIEEALRLREKFKGDTRTSTASTPPTRAWCQTRGGSPH